MQTGGLSRSFNRYQRILNQTIKHLYTMESKRNLSAIHPSKVFYGYIYPIYAKDFLFGSNYQLFAEKVQESFVLTSEQWETVLQEWEMKEMILSDK